MNKEIINKFAEEMIDLLKNVKDFTGTQIPLVCQEILKYETFQNIIWFSVWATLALSLFVSSVYFGKCYYKHKNKYENEGVLVTCVVFGICGLIISLIAICELLNVLQIIFAPRMFLIEYFARLISSK